MSTRAVIYARISKDADGNEAGVKRQIESCTHLAQAREWTLLGEPLVDDDVSAFSGAKRAAYAELMGMIERREVDAVIAWHMDRLCRRVADLVDLMKLAVGDGKRPAVKIATVHGDLDLSSPVGRMFATILIAVAEYESAHKGERHAAANAAAARQGRRRRGTPRPFGYQADHVTPEPDEAAALEAGYRMILAGGTLAGVAREWTKLGVRPVQQRRRRDQGPDEPSRWNRSSVKTILLNPANAGIMAYLGEEIPVTQPDWTPIVSEPTFRQVRSILTDQSRDRARGTKTLLGGLARCRCGNQVIGSTNQLGQPIYRCWPDRRDGRPGPHVTVRLDPVDEWVEAVVCERLSRPDAADLIAPPEPSGVDVIALQEEAAVIRGNLDELAADRALGLVNRSQMLAATERANNRLAEIAAKLTEASRESVFADLVGVGDVREVWGRLDLSRRRAVVEALYAVTLHPPGRGARVFDPEAVVEFGSPIGEAE